MGAGREGGTSFMEITRTTESGRPPGCSARTCSKSANRIAATKPSLEIHPLGIGGKEARWRLVFDAPAGPALNASLIDMGNRFRLLVNEVVAVKATRRLPQAARSPAPSGSAARFQDCLRVLDSRRRCASYGLTVTA